MEDQLVDEHRLENRFELARTEYGGVLKLRGSWRLSDGVVSPESLFDEQALTGVTRIEVDASELQRWDSALVAFLLRLHKCCERAKIGLDMSALPGGAQRLTELALAVPEQAQTPRSEVSAGFVETLGASVLASSRSASEMVGFLGETLIALSRVPTRRAQTRVSDIYRVVQTCGPEALPIVTLISFLVGMILAFVGLVQLEQFGADVYVANLVAVAMVREMGGMMTGIIMAGRTGAAFAAELGTMNVNDETAAFRTIGIRPIEFLVLPRMLALVFTVPLLTIYANVVGMFGGSAVCAMLSDVSLQQYYGQLASSVDLVDWSGGLFKAAVYGVIVAIAGCLRGLQCSKSAAAVGNATTSAVVTAIVGIVTAEAILTVAYTVLGI